MEKKYNQNHLEERGIKNEHTTNGYHVDMCLVVEYDAYYREQRKIISKPFLILNLNFKI